MTDGRVGLNPQTYSILDREVRLPVEVRDATASVAYYVVSADAAQALIAPSGLAVARILPGRALCTIGAMRYKDGDLGPYYEVAVTFFVHEHDAPPTTMISTAQALLAGKLASYIHQLPVDGEFTCEAGREIWGFPKFMAEIEQTRAESIETTRLSVDGEHILTQRMRLGGSRRFGERRQVSYAFRDGVLYRTPHVMSGERVGFRIGGERLRLGKHPIADELRLLGLPKRPLFSTRIGRLRGTFGAAEAVGREG